MLLVVGSPGLRRAALDQLATQRSAAYGRDLAAYGRTLQQRNSLLRAIREEQAGRDELRFWDASFLDAGGAIVAERLRLLEDLAGPLARAHAEIAPDEAGAARLAISYATNAPALPGESPRDALARRLAETADKEVWNGSTLVGPHRDDLVFGLDGRDMSGFASRGQQRTAILAFKLAELDLLTAQDGRPPLLLLDDVFSRARSRAAGSHLVRRIAELPQAFVTTTTLDDLDPALVRAATAWEVRPRRRRRGAAPIRRTAGNGPARARPSRRSGLREPERRAVSGRRRPMVRLGDLLPDAARGLGLEDELRLSRAMATFEQLVAERVPGSGRRLPGDPDRRLRGRSSRPTRRSSPRSSGCAAPELLAAFAATPAGIGARELRVDRRPLRPAPEDADRRRGRDEPRIGLTVPAIDPPRILPGPASQSRGARPERNRARLGVPRRPSPIPAPTATRDPDLAVRLQMKLGVIAEPDRSPNSPDTVVVVEPTIGAIARSKGHLYLIVTSTIASARAQEATQLAAETIRGEYYYDESAGIRVCIEKAIASANKRLNHQRERLGLHGTADNGPIGIGIAVVRGNELYVATIGPAEAYLIRQARLSTLPDPHRERGLPTGDLEPDVWRGEISVGDSLVLVSPNVMTRLGPDELKDAMVTLHPQPAMEHLHHRYLAADGEGSDAMIAFEATEVAVDPPLADARPGPPGRAAGRRARPLADPARRQRHRRRGRRPGLGHPGPERRRRGARPGSSSASRTSCPIAGRRIGG